MVEGKERKRRTLPSDTELTKSAFEFGLSLHATQAIIMGYFHISKSALQRWTKENYGGQTFEQVAEQCRGYGNMLLLQNLFALSKTNPAAAIFLAKNWLGMSDDPHPVDTGEARREFNAAIKSATKALEASDLSMIADIPDMAEGGGGSAEEEA